MRAQVSLEYILLLCGFLGAFLLLLPSASNSFNSALFALDCANAKYFLSDFEEETAKLSILGTGSTGSVEARPFGEWVLEVNKGNASLTVFGKNNLKKDFSLSLRCTIAPFSEVFHERKILNLSKGRDRILIVHNYSEFE